MSVKNPQFGINLRKNDNQYNPGYGQYYPKAQERETISLAGLIKHMADHNSIYGEDVIEGVLKKMRGCIIELLSQGNSAQIDTWHRQRGFHLGIGYHYVAREYADLQPK